MKALILLLVTTASLRALTFDDVQSYVKQNQDVTFPQYASVLTNGMMRWQPSPTPNATYRVYYGRSTGNYTSKKDVGTATTFALPYTLTGKEYFIVVKAVVNGRESVPTAEVRGEKK